MLNCMRKNLSQHKTVARECPNCHKIKSFPARNDTCSPACANEWRARPSTDVLHEIRGNVWEVSLPETNIGTEAELVAQFEIDLTRWNIDKFTVSRNRSKVADAGQFALKARLTRKIEQNLVRDELAAMALEFKRQRPPVKPIKHSTRISGNMLELTIPDLHMGKLAWAPETGYRDYDVRIAERTFEAALAALVQRTAAFDYDQVLLVIGNDLLNTDSIEDTTTAGTQVSTDTRYFKTFEVTRRMLTRAIEQLRLLAPVKVVVVPGNHDTLSSWHMGNSLECYFHACPDVTVDNEPTQRKYHQHGNVMLMWSHGDKGKRSDLPLLMATERPAMFGATKYREIHTGDLHQVRLEETHGIRLRILPALCAPDDWHSGNGYVGNVASAEAYVWSAVEGLISMATYSVPD